MIRPGLMKPKIATKERREAMESETPHELAFKRGGMLVVAQNIGQPGWRRQSAISAAPNRLTALAVLRRRISEIETSRSHAS